MPRGRLETAVPKRTILLRNLSHQCRACACAYGNEADNSRKPKRVQQAELAAVREQDVAGQPRAC